jgi:hypothetical protein
MWKAEGRTIKRSLNMKTRIKTSKLTPFAILVTCACLLIASGCARYARNVNVLYEPTASVSGGSGELYIVIPENRQTHSPDIKWVIGKVTGTDNQAIDELFSPRSPAEIIQAAFRQEFKKAGYTVISGSKRPATEQLTIDLTKTEVELEQISAFADIKVTCRVLVGVDVFSNGQLIKRVQYESTSSRTEIKDRDILARDVLEDALQSVMKQAVPELHSLFKR